MCIRRGYIGIGATIGDWHKSGNRHVPHAQILAMSGQEKSIIAGEGSEWNLTLLGPTGQPSETILNQHNLSCV